MEELKQKGIIFKIERYRLDDGPGIRTAVFLKGCPLKCLWCSNPESQSPYPEIMYNENLCIKCGECREVCPTDAIAMLKEGKPSWKDYCINCGECARVCPSKALKMIGKVVTVEEVLKEVVRDMPFYQESGGGVTITGGEPLSQPEFTRALMKVCKEKGIHTTLDTSGYGKWEDLKKILEYTDLVLYDIKHMDPKEHVKYTGVNNEIILENARKIVQEGIPIIIRLPIIPGINDSKGNISKLIEFLKELSITYVEVLPYHRLGVSKYKMLGRKYALEDLEPPSRECLRSIKEVFEKHGIKAKILI